jgi:hypothetical protein
MGRRNSRRTQTGTDVTRLWNLPKTEASAVQLPEENLLTMSGASPSRSQGSTGPPHNVDMTELKELTAHLEEVIKEAHGVLKDLRIETRQARRIMPMIVTNMIKKQVHEQVDRLGKETEAAIRMAVDSVNKTFDDLGKILLGTDKESKKKGYVPLTEIIEDVAAGRAVAVQHVEGEPNDGQFLLGRKIGVTGNPFGISTDSMLPKLDITHSEKLLGEDDG